MQDNKQKIREGIQFGFRKGNMAPKNRKAIGKFVC